VFDPYLFFSSLFFFLFGDVLWFAFARFRYDFLLDSQIEAGHAACSPLVAPIPFTFFSCFSPPFDLVAGMGCFPFLHGSFFIRVHFFFSLPYGLSLSNLVPLAQFLFPLLFFVTLTFVATRFLLFCCLRDIPPLYFTQSFSHTVLLKQIMAPTPPFPVGWGLFFLSLTAF